MSRLLLVRHGVTEYNNDRRFAGYSNVELASEGYQQAEYLRDRLAGEKIDAIYTSDLKRAFSTAEIIASVHNVDIMPCPELREMNYGDIEGMTYQEIQKSHPEVAELISQYSLDLEFPGGESFRGFIERVSKFIDRLDKHGPSETILIVSHNGPLRVLVCKLLGIGYDHWRQIGCDNVSLSILETRRGSTMMTLLNDTSHLRGK